MNITTSKIAALSQKMEVYCKPDHLTDRYINTTIFENDSRYNLTSILTEWLITVLKAPIDKKQIDNVLDGYNAKAGTTFSVEEFYDRGWIRFINNRYKLACLVHNDIWSLENAASSTAAQLKLGSETEIGALKVLHDLLYNKSDYTISEEALSAIIERYTDKITPAFFVSKEIATIAEDGSYHIQHHSDYLRTLTNRIAAEGWHRIMAGEKDMDNFRKYVALLLHCN